MHPRNAVFVGLTFIIVGAIYYAAPALFGGHVDGGGVTMLFALSIAMTLMFYVLMAGVPRDN